MESIVYDRIIGKSIQCNHFSCLFDWITKVEAENTVEVLYLDFSKAFDRVPKCCLLLLHKLQHLGLRGNLLKWIDAFLSNRTFRVKVDDVFSQHFEV